MRFGIEKCCQTRALVYVVTIFCIVLLRNVEVFWDGTLCFTVSSSRLVEGSHWVYLQGHVLFLELLASEDKGVAMP